MKQTTQSLLLLFIGLFLSSCAYPPNSAMAYNNQGARYAKSGHYDMAIRSFNKALELQPEFAGAYFNKGLAYTHKRMLAKALEQFDLALEINPNYADALDARGLLYLITGTNKDKACVDLKKACEMGVCKAYNLAKKKGDC